MGNHPALTLLTMIGGIVWFALTIILANRQSRKDHATEA